MFNTIESMHQEQYFVESRNVFPDHFIIIGDELHHIVKVKRKKPGDTIRAIDGAGNGYIGIIKELSQDYILVETKHNDWRQNEANVRLTMAMGIIKQDRFEWVIEKGTELGIIRFIPMVTEYTLLKSIRLDRWQRIVRAAVKQSGRSICPEISSVTLFSTIVENVEPFDRKIIVHPSITSDDLKPMPSVKKNAQVIVMIGPEGGFSEQEVNMACKNSFDLMNLGRRRLRSETAAIVATSVILNQLNEF